MINFYRNYIKDGAKTQAPLHELLKGSTKNDRRKVIWTNTTKDCFEKCKQDISQVALNTYPDSDYPLALLTDASDWTIGSVIQQQKIVGSRYPKKS